eukprot:Nk52_evm2s293 gene=Nk52_evmTU2s293
MFIPKRGQKRVNREGGSVVGCHDGVLLKSFNVLVSNPPQQWGDSFKNGSYGDIVIPELAKLLLEQEGLVYTDEPMRLLSVYEAVYLADSVGKLSLGNMSAFYTLLTRNCWGNMCDNVSNGLKEFLGMYICYGHFRSLGWVVKSGLKYGADFVLYKDGPVFYHSTYCVTVVTVYENEQEDELKWRNIMAASRCSENVKKQTAICTVRLDTKKTLCERLKTPNAFLNETVSNAHVAVQTFGRWAPGKSRE